MQKRTPKITISKKQKQLGDILKNASKSRCEPEIHRNSLSQTLALDPNRRPAIENQES
jgi:hypothetical protein